MKEPLYRKLAGLLQARANCERSGNREWFDKHTERIEALVKEHMPSGSGFDNGTTIDLDKSTADRLVFRTSFHHMNEGGMYDGWTEHAVNVTASLAQQFDLYVTGRDRNDIKDYIGETFHHTLGEEVE